MATKKTTATVTQTTPAQGLTGTKRTDKNLSTKIVPIQLTRIRQSVGTWRDAIREMEFAYFPHRVKAQQLYMDTWINGHVAACAERRKDLTLLRKFQFCDKAGEVDVATTELFTKNVNGKIQARTWFNNFISYSLDSIFFGYSLIAFGDIQNNEFPDLNVVRRWDISPDRKIVTTFPYQPNGMQFLEEPYRKWHAWITTPNDIGTSDCGYGMLYKVAIYEIFLRNMLGYNGDFVEMFAQPYRVGKTTKTEETERAEFAQTLQDMGSAGWAMMDPQDSIEFLETALGGTGYKSYDNFESRLQKIISKVMLGHADALDSTPGKLGASQGEESPTAQALEDKQTKDGAFIEAIVNDMLIPRLREMGFIIPDGVNFGFKNDAEVMKNAFAMAGLAEVMAKGGLQMDEGYFTQETGVAVAAKAPVVPIDKAPSVREKVAAFYRTAAAR